MSRMRSVARAGLRALAFPALAVLVMVGGPRLLGWEAYALGSGSMQPAIMAGSVVVVRSVPPADVRIGDVVAIGTPSGVLIHRVVAFDASGSLIVKGDANDVIDQRQWPAESLVGKVAYAVPQAGYVALLLQDPFLGSLPAITLVLALALLARPQTQRFALAAALAGLVASWNLASAAAPFSAASTSGPSDVSTDRLLPASALAGDAIADGIDLTWSASPSDNVHYVIERCMGRDCTSFAPLTSVTGTSHLDETVDRHTWYGYRVAAAYASWTSAYTPAVWVRAR